MISGTITNFVVDWTNVIVNAMLGGELLSYRCIICDINLTEIHTSHYDHLLTCYVSAIHGQNDVNLSHYHLCAHPDHLCSVLRSGITEQEFLRG